MSGRDSEHRSKGGDASRDEEAATPAPHPVNRLHADPVVAQAIFRRAVQRRRDADRAAEATSPSTDAGVRQGLDALPVQLAGDGAAQDAGTVHETAARGVSGAGETLPHLATIQRAFGSHDV